ncbi:MAG: PEP/pyruvate-binding domain-containing protein [Pirellulales bacterium]
MRRGWTAERLERRELMAGDLLSPMTSGGAEEWVDASRLDGTGPVGEVALWSALSSGEAEVAAFSATSQLVPQDATDGRTTIQWRDEPFAAFAGGFSGVRYVKGSILLSDPGTVYFQDSVKYLYHYDFARERLAPFLGLTPDEFGEVSLHRAGQQVVMVSVLLTPDSPEIAVQLVGQDAYPREDVARWIHTVAAAVQSEVPLKVLYLPSYEQSAAAQADQEWLAEQGITVTDSTRWMRGDVAYADGWATGRLVNIPAAQIPAAYGDGRLRPTDILLLSDGVPAEVPYVRGIITLVPAVPNSHVAILARNQQLPFIWVQNPAEQQRLRSLVGHSVLLRASAARIDVAPLDEPLLPVELANWLTAQQTPEAAHITPKESYGQWLDDATDLTPDQIKYFGGKAANYGLLRRTIPDNSQRAMAFSFDLWDAFMSNINPATGRTLREEIQLRLGSFSYPPDMTLARQRLAEVNTLIRKTVKWTDEQRQQILGELIAGFPDVPHDQFLRFRSSSNAEDSQELTGAGLYDSYSGCIADDTDGDNVGPSRADPNERDEKGVFRAIEKVFASFYNENAWLERLRHGVNEADTGMAILVHHNFPDSQEMANGVVTFKYQRSQFGDQEETSYSADIVTQLGALSVTNPEGGAIAEVVKAFGSPTSDPYVYVQTSSTLVPLGSSVMTWQDDYTELMRLVSRVAEGYADLYPGKDEFTLDLEFKRMVPGKIIVKQVREIPTAQSEMVAPQILNTPTEWKVLQSEFSDVWSNHRLKSTLSLQTINGSLTGNNPLKHVRLSLLGGASPVVLDGVPQSFPGAAFSGVPGELRNSFRLGSGSSGRTYTLTTTYPAEVDGTLSPVITAEDFAQELRVKYDRPVPWLTPASPEARFEDRVLLVPADKLVAATEVQTRTWQVGGVQIVTRFKWANAEAGQIIKTMPLGEWVDTVITGLTTEPIRLTGDASQTYAPGHHNFTEEFLFEPGLEASLTARQRAELATKNIRLLHVSDDRANLAGTASPTTRLTYVGWDDKFRVVSEVDMPDLQLRIGGSGTLVATGVDTDGRKIVFRNPTWIANGGGNVVRQGNQWVFTASQTGRWEVTVTDPAFPGMTGRATVLVTGIELGSDAVLRVVGTANGDRILLRMINATTLEVRTDFLTGSSRTQTFPLDQIYRVEIQGGAGRDTITAEGVTLPLTIDAGDGDDVIRGGTRNDILLGGQGADSIWGGDGDDILLGGAGADLLLGELGRNLVIGGEGRNQLVGGAGEDILIGGRTVFSDPTVGFAVDVRALQALLDEWTAERTASRRRENLQGQGSGERRNDDFFLLLGLTVFDDGGASSILNRQRRHWVLAR